MLLGIFSIAALPLPAAAQAPLVVGSVRDQHGAPIRGATVLAVGPGVAASAGTDAAGTFALAAAGIRAVTVVCRFCQSATVAVTPGEPLVAIVRRYDALLHESPSPSDLANLPYAHVEEAVALKPFALLQQSTAPVPGSALADRGLLPSNALLVDANVPNYDVVFGVSPYSVIPAQYETSAGIAPPSDAFLYGDRAGSGIVTLSPFEGDGADAALALLGHDAIARVQTGSNGTYVAAGTSSDAQESRQRADAQLTMPLSSNETIVVNGGSEQGRAFDSPDGTFASNFAFGNASFDDVQPSADLHASFQADRGGYGAQPYRSLADVWSDVGFDAGVRTNGEVAAFADASTRLSTGTYAASYATAFGAQLRQNRFDAGVDVVTPDLDATAGVGWFGAGYSGGAAGSASLTYARLATPSLAMTLFPQGKWSAALSASGSFDLPTLWQQYGWDDDYATLAYDRSSLYAATLSYTDGARVRVSAEAASQRVRGYFNGIVTSDGFALDWQAAPNLSVRAWTMFVSNAIGATEQAPYAPSASPAVDALWLTYENGGALRVDAIYRRDVLDGAPFFHFDGDVSGPISPRLRWYAGAEDRQRVTAIDAGVRFSP